MEPSQSSSLGSHRVRKRGRVACKSCRQAKVRCGMAAPPCARCLRHGLDCSFDAQYRRVKTGERFEELESSVSRLRNLVREPGSSAPEPAQASKTPREFHPGSQSSQCEADNRNGILSPHQSRNTSVDIGTADRRNQAQLLDSPRPSLDAANSSPASRSIGSIQLSPEQIHSLFSM